MSTDQTTNQEQEQQTLDEDVIYTQLYEKGKVENYTMGDHLVTQRVYVWLKAW
jgi:hypothetical protein